MRLGLTPWRRIGKIRLIFPRPQIHSFWSEEWRGAEQRLETVETAILDRGGHVRRGGDYDRWDFQVSGGLWGAVRGRITIEEHGGGKQMVRYRSWPLIKGRSWLVLAVFVGLGVAAAIVVGLAGSRGPGAGSHGGSGPGVR